MQKTLQSLKTLRNYKNADMSLEDISCEYQKTLDPSLLAEAFCRCYTLIISVSDKYYGLTSEDIASYSLQEIDFCLISFDTTKGAKFSTYLYRVLCNRFREATISLSQQKRVANMYTQDIDDILDMPCNFSEFGYVELNATLDKCGLTTTQRKYCNYIVAGWSTKDICAFMNVTPQRLAQHRKSLRQKLTFMVYDLKISSI